MSHAAGCLAQRFESVSVVSIQLHMVVRSDGAHRCGPCEKTSAPGKCTAVPAGAEAQGCPAAGAGPAGAHVPAGAAGAAADQRVPRRR